jgi:spore germination protein YaaH
MRFLHGIGSGVVVSALAATVACGRLPGGSPPPATVWLLHNPDEGVTQTAASLPAGIAGFVGPLIIVDSASFVPLQGSASENPPAGVSRVSLVTTYQGTRYHPESVRALTEDSVAATQFAGALSRMVAATSSGLFIDFQGGTPDELTHTTSLLRSIADSARARNLSPIGIVVPPGDTVGYPTAVLARTADLIVVRLAGEHRAGTSPGTLASPEWVTRQIGIRASEIGVSRLVAELPLFGYLWDATGAERRITYSEAQALVRRQAGVFRRDAASGSLTASSVRDGWTIWISDARTLEILIGVARHAGVRRFALLGVDGADPEIWTRIPLALSR